MKARLSKIIFISLTVLEVLTYLAGSVSIFLLAPLAEDSGNSPQIALSLAEWSLFMLVVWGCTYLVYRSVQKHRRRE